jgi:hypothetical protein
MARIGLNARNDVFFPEEDFRLIQEARIETLKILSLTDVSVCERIRRENPSVEFIVRLWDKGFGLGKHPAPQEFVERVAPRIQAFRPYAEKFEIHNEPNHFHKLEGWGSSDEQARDFRDWYLEVLRRLRELFPWAKFGFPGLAINYPHRDLEWLEICRDAVEESDWLGCHCYWQYENHLSPEWGLRFKLYHELFPHKPIEITEFGDSTPNLSPEDMARKYVEYYQELYKYPYVNSACSFIASSPDPAWAPFAWRTEEGVFRPVVQAVAKMPRRPPARYFEETGFSVGRPFLDLLDKIGLEICGLPLSQEVEEDGVRVQYFQKVLMVRLPSGEAALGNAGERLLKLKEELEGLRASLEGPAPVLEPIIEDISARLPRHPSERYSRRELSAIKYLVVHHSAIPPDKGPEVIARYHVEKQGWPGIGYHYFIDPQGKIYQTNPLEVISYHARTYNSSGVGICLAGDFTNSTPPMAQISALGHLCAFLLEKLGLDKSAIVGHQELVPTICPGGKWKEWKSLVLKAVDEAPRQGFKPLYHYMLFWQKGDNWASEEWEAARNYVAKFRPTCGFSVKEALQARYVTIVGDEDKVGKDAEELLIRSGCKVERLSYADIASLKKLLDDMVAKGQRFLSLA